MKHINKNNSSHSIKNNPPSLNRMRFMHCVWSNFVKMEGYIYQDELVEQVFKDNQSHSDKRQVWKKCAVLNSMYSTNLMDAFRPTVEHICGIVNLTILIKEGDVSAVSQIENVCVQRDTAKLYKRCTSFASKYCHFHNPKAYPIFDRHVRRMLYYINKQHPFYDRLTLENMESYHCFKDVVDAFIRKFLSNDSTSVSYKDFDRYIWTWAKMLLGDEDFKRVINYQGVFPSEIPEDLRLYR